MHLGRVVRGAEPQVALLLLQPARQRGVDGDLAPGHPRPDLVGAGRGERREPAEPAGVGRGDGQRAAVGGQRRQRHRQHRAHPAGADDRAAHRVGDRPRAGHQQVGGQQRRLQVPRVRDGVRRRVGARGRGRRHRGREGSRRPGGPGVRLLRGGLLERVRAARAAGQRDHQGRQQRADGHRSPCSPHGSPLATVPRRRPTPSVPHPHAAGEGRRRLLRGSRRPSCARPRDPGARGAWTCSGCTR